MATIEARGLRKSFNGTIALDGVDLRKKPLDERYKMLRKIVKPFPLLKISGTNPYMASPAKKH